MSTTRTITDIPTAEVDTVESDFVSEGCTVVKKQQTDGNWTVIATCPDPKKAGPAGAGVSQH
jgi:hypothetical protein